VTRIDYLVLTRLASRIGIAALVLFAIIFLVESLAGPRTDHLARIGGPLLGAAGAAVAAAIWSIRFLPITVLIGAVIGLLELRMRMELPVVNASGISIWRILRAPLLGVMALGVLLGFMGDGALVVLTRAMSANLPTANSGDELWLRQTADGEDYVMVSRRPHPGGAVLEEVTFFLPESLGGPRIEAPRAELRNGAWEIPEGVRHSAREPAQRLVDARVPTTSTAGDMGARLASPYDMTFFELLQLGSRRFNEPALKTGINMRLATLLALPVMLGASLILAFAFTTGYRRTNKYGGTVLYGIVLGFVFYVVMELARRAGFAGVLQPTIAAFGPAFVAMVVGTTVLLFREDGRT
jgi:lipopolysaccharide export system permease protein